VFDNLNRISLDKNYIENLIFRLNHKVEPGNRSGYELTEKCSLLFSQTLQNILKIFLKSLAQQKGIERNLLIKKFIKNILYSKEQIQINLYYTEDFDASSNSILPYGVGVGGDKKEKGISISLSENPQFVLLNLARLTCYELFRKRRSEQQVPITAQSKHRARTVGRPSGPGSATAGSGPG